MTASIALVCGDARLSIALRGAEPLAWSIGQTPLLWSPDPAIWPQTAPILFPVVGWTRNCEIRHAGRTYPLGLHGFAASGLFELVEQGADFAVLRLEANHATREKYPFDFRLDAVYRLEANALVWTLEASNRGAETMPYALGLHPGFCWPLAGSQAAHSFAFDRAERADVPVIAPGGLFSSERRAVPLEAIPVAPNPNPSPLWGGEGEGVARSRRTTRPPTPTLPRKGGGSRLELCAELMANEALCFLDIASMGATFDNGAGARLRVELADFPHLALWARPPAPFLCIEAWTGHGDPVGFTGEISDKPSMRLLPPGAKARHSARFSFVTAAAGADPLGAAAPV